MSRMKKIPSMNTRKRALRRRRRSWRKKVR